MWWLSGAIKGCIPGAKECVWKSGPHQEPQAGLWQVTGHLVGRHEKGDPLHLAVGNPHWMVVKRSRAGSL